MVLCFVNIIAMLHIVLKSKKWNNAMLRKHHQTIIFLPPCLMVLVVYCDFNSGLNSLYTCWRKPSLLNKTNFNSSVQSKNFHFTMVQFLHSFQIEHVLGSAFYLIMTLFSVEQVLR